MSCSYTMFSPEGDAAVDSVVQQAIALLDEKSPPEAYVYLRNGLARLELTHPEVMGSEVRQFIMMHLKPELQWRGIEYDREFLYRTVISEVFEEIGLDEFWDLAQNLIEKTKQQYKDFLEE